MKKLWVWGAVVAFLVLGTVALLWFPRINHIVVEMPQNDHISYQDMEALLAPYKGKRFLQLSLVSVRQTVEAHPWVTAAQVRRVWPDTLKVQVHLEVPVARWGDKGLVNAQGKVFFPESSAGYEDLLPLSAPTVQSAPLLLQKAQWLMGQTDLLNWHLTGIRLLPGGSLETRWFPERVIWLNVDASEAQFSRFLAAWPKVKPSLRDQASEVDLRYSNGFTVK